jgi:hypothetical protein
MRGGILTYPFRTTGQVYDIDFDVKDNFTKFISQLSIFFSAYQTTMHYYGLARGVVQR